MSKYLPHTTLLSALNILSMRPYKWFVQKYLHCTDEATEAQRGYTHWPGSQGQQIAKPGLEPKPLDPRSFWYKRWGLFHLPLHGSRLPLLQLFTQWLPYLSESPQAHSCIVGIGEEKLLVLVLCHYDLMWFSVSGRCLLGNHQGQEQATEDPPGCRGARSLPAQPSRVGRPVGLGWGMPSGKILCSS